MIIECKRGTNTITFDSQGNRNRLLLVDGLGSQFDVYTSASNIDGEIYQSSKGQKRNIVLTVEASSEDYENNLSELYTFFQPNVKGTMFLYGKKIDYYPESVDPSNTDFSVVVSLICPDPNFYDAEETPTTLASWHGLIHFPFTMESTFQVTERVTSLIANIYNGSSVEMGLTVKFSASGAVVNPSLYDVNRQILMKVNCTMQTGDLITVTTQTGNKQAVLTRGGVESNVGLVYPPKFLHVYEGDNLFRYNADSGIDNLNVEILSAQGYFGV